MRKSPNNNKKAVQVEAELMEIEEFYSLFSNIPHSTSDENRTSLVEKIKKYNEFKFKHKV